ncbi:MAG TPA: phosphate acyltransferase [Gemmatimonadales bacterium]
MTCREVLRERARGLGVRLVLPEGHDPRVQRAAEILARLGIAEPRLLGLEPITPDNSPDLVAIADRLAQRRPRLAAGNQALALAADPIRFGAGLVALGLADGCVAGVATATADVVRAALALIGLAPGVSSASAAMYLGLADRTLTFTDVAVVPTPSVDQMAHAALAAARDRRALLGDEPVVAFLSYSTNGSAVGPEVDRMRAARDLFRALAPDIVADGEMQLDAALVPGVAARKWPSSEAAGRANVLVFPSLDAANIGYKLTERLAGASAAGPLLQGLAKPMSDLSRGADTDDIVDVAAMVALQTSQP